MSSYKKEKNHLEKIRDYKECTYSVSSPVLLLITLTFDTECVKTFDSHIIQHHTNHRSKAIVKLLA